MNKEKNKYRDLINLRGFTLLEFLISISIIAIIGTISFAIWRGYYTTAVVDTEARAVLSFVRSARQNAMANDSSSDYSVKFLSDSCVGFLGSTYVPGDSANEIQEVSDVTLTSTFPNDIVTFTNFNGRATASGTVTVTGNTGIIKNITINELGIIDY